MASACLLLCLSDTRQSVSLSACLSISQADLSVRPSGFKSVFVLNTCLYCHLLFCVYAVLSICGLPACICNCMPVLCMYVDRAVGLSDHLRVCLSHCQLEFQ